LIYDDTMATHLYHIAQESVNNALKHGHARNIQIKLTTENGRGLLAISDDGAGMAENHGNSHGMGLHIMNYRAGMIGGTLEVAPDPIQGTIVTCLFPLKPGR